MSLMYVMIASNFSKCFFVLIRYGQDIDQNQWDRIGYSDERTITKGFMPLILRCFRQPARDSFLTNRLFLTAQLAMSESQVAGRMPCFPRVSNI